MRVNRARLRELVEITLDCEEEDTDYREGHFEREDGSNDDELCDWIREQLQMGNRWAWCTAHVVVKYKGLRGDDWLGACSYASEADFKDGGGYYESMVGDALDELAKQIEAIAAPHGLFEIEGTLCLQCVVAS